MPCAGFAVVKLAVDKATDAEYACKIMALPQPGETPGENENTREDIFKEIDILCSLNHDNVVFLKEYFEDGNKVGVLAALVPAGAGPQWIAAMALWVCHKTIISDPDALDTTKVINHGIMA
jgi:serine/threonine protein kinase